MNRKVAHPVLTGLLLIPFLLGVLAAPTAALGPGPGPVQPIPPAQLDRSTRFVGASVRATTDPLKSQQLLGNPGFEAGTWLPWEAFGAPALDGAIRHGGSLSAHLGNADSANDQAIQAVAIPAGAGEITLDF